jgi:SlyX protein
MTEDELTTRFERLEGRLMHQEAALEEMTRILLAQEEHIREQAELLKRLTEHLRAALPSQLAPPEDEAPPPHY